MFVVFVTPPALAVRGRGTDGRTATSGGVRVGLARELLDARESAPAPSASRSAATSSRTYGDLGMGPPKVTAATIARLRELVAFIVGSAAAGDPAQTAVRERGDVGIYERDIAYPGG
jgi:hypothetical protein